MTFRGIKTIAVLLGLLACAACTSNAADFLQVSGYDTQEAQTGSELPLLNTLTPY